MRKKSKEKRTVPTFMTEERIIIRKRPQEDFWNSEKCSISSSGW